jgi:hypothetical protein
MDEEPRDYTHDEIIAKVQWLYEALSHAQAGSRDEMKVFAGKDYDELTPDEQAEHQFHYGRLQQLEWIIEMMYTQFERFLINREYY